MSAIVRLLKEYPAKKCEIRDFIAFKRSLTFDQDLLMAVIIV